jgi:hypothetical protein
MATLKVKKVKGHEYFYWSKSVRSHKRFGGDGRVRTVDHLIGTHPISGNWLPYRLWSGDVALEQYSEALIKYLCPRYWEALVSVTVSWDKPNPKVSITSIVPMFADCRARKWRKERATLQSALNQIIECSTLVQANIEACAYHLALHDESMEKAKAAREAAREARFKSIEEWADADLCLDEDAANWETFADEVIRDYYLRDWERLPMFAPPSLRSQFRVAAQTRIEKLSKNRGWYEQYKAEVN